MRRVLGALLVGALMGGVLLPGIAFAGAGKVNVCHRMASGGYDLIEVGEPAYATHLAHGDGAIGGPVPGKGPAWVFDASCNPYERPPVILARVWSVDAAGVSHEMARVEDTNYDGVPSTGDAVLLDQFPFYETPDSPVSYGHFTVTNHKVASWGMSHDGTIADILWIISDTGGRFVMADYIPAATSTYDEIYLEEDLATGTMSFWMDMAPPNSWDTVSALSGSAGRPDRDGYTYGPASVDLLRIEFDFPY